MNLACPVVLLDVHYYLLTELLTLFCHTITLLKSIFTTSLLPTAPFRYAWCSFVQGK